MQVQQSNFLIFERDKSDYKYRKNYRYLPRVQHQKAIVRVIKKCLYINMKYLKLLINILKIGLFSQKKTRKKIIKIGF